MQTMTDYAQAGYEGIQTDAIYSSALWYAEQAGQFCKSIGLYPQEAKMSRGYSVLINRKYIVTFDKNDKPTIKAK